VRNKLPRNVDMNLILQTYLINSSIIRSTLSEVFGIINFYIMFLFLLSISEVNIKYWSRDFQTKLIFCWFSGRTTTFYRKKNDFYNNKKIRRSAVCHTILCDTSSRCLLFFQSFWRTSLGSYGAKLLEIEQILLWLVDLAFSKF
jgi:hypothetical protein